MWQLLSLCDRYYGCTAFAGFSIYLVITDVSAWLNFCEPRFSIYTSSIFGHALLKDGSESFISMMLWSPSSGKKRISCLMKVTTASLKRCDKRFWTFFEQSMSECQAGVSAATMTLMSYTCKHKGFSIVFVSLQWFLWHSMRQLRLSLKVMEYSNWLLLQIFHKQVKLHHLFPYWWTH